MGSTMIYHQLQAFLEENHATNIVAYDISARSPLAEAMVICTARSSVHARSLGDSVKTYMAAHTHNVHVEGLEQGDWILVDSAWIMVHIMQQDARDYYNLDSLWATEG